MNTSQVVPWSAVPVGAMVVAYNRWHEVLRAYDRTTGTVRLTGSAPDRGRRGGGFAINVSPDACPVMLVPTFDEAVAFLRAAGWEVIENGPAAG